MFNHFNNEPRPYLIATSYEHCLQYCRIEPKYNKDDISPNVLVEEELVGVKKLDDWINWLYSNSYIDFDVYNRMKIYYNDGKIYSGKCSKDYLKDSGDTLC